MNKYIVGLAAAALMASTSANAAFVMYLDDSSTAGIDRIIQDDTLAGALTGIGLTTSADTTPDAGVVTYSGAIGSFLVNVTTGISKPMIGAPGTMLDLNSVSVSGGSGTLTLGLTDTGFLRAGAASLNFSIGGTTDGTVTADAFVDFANTEFGTGTLLGSMTAGSTAFSYDSGVTIVPTDDPFSLSIVASVTHGPLGGISSFDAAVVPEPSMLALMCLGLVGLGFTGRKRRSS